MARNRRILPQRAAKKIVKLQSRTAMKPKRRRSNLASIPNLSPSEIIKLYTNCKLTHFFPKKLETIFEEPEAETEFVSGDEAEGSGNNKLVKCIGMRKIKRSLSCSNGRSVTKTVTKQRRAKIKKAFGGRKTFTKISLATFLERLNKSRDDGDSDDPTAPPDAEAMETND